MSEVSETEPDKSVSLSSARTEAKPEVTVYAGLFLVTLATLMYELLLSRIFSVLTLYHFAFMAVSIGLLGATAGALAVYLFPHHFRADRAATRMGTHSLLFSLSILFSLVLLAYVPFTFEKYWVHGYGNTWRNYLNIVIVFSGATLPFFFSGLCVTIALTRYPSRVAGLYSVDLIGAALGCILIILVLNWTNGATAMIVIAGIAALAAFCFYAAIPGVMLKSLALVSTIGIGGFAIYHTGLVNRQTPLIRFRYVKGWKEKPFLYEKWNAFSRVHIAGNPKELKRPVGWGLSKTYQGNPVRQLGAVIDAGASTQLTHFDGDLSRIEYLKYDIVNLANELRSNANVLAIGSGGGRDILSALVYGQKAVTGVEINNATVTAITGPYADFVGNLHKLPNVKIVNDEARSFVTRSTDRFDIIQISLIDTWAASSAGAYVLTENSLYTVEGWKTFLDHLSPGGILTCSRWYNKMGPTEVYRTVALASKALFETGVKDPRKHILGVRTYDNRPGESGIFAATLVVSNLPFTEDDLTKAQEFCDRLGFGVFLSPHKAESREMMLLAEGKAKEIELDLPVRLQPSTDDNPFFFNYVKFRDVLRPAAWENEYFQFNMKATLILAYLLIGVSIATFLVIIVPLFLCRRTARGTDFWPFLLYFACIGMGFMLIEISQMQRLIIFLGHPVYGLAVVLFSLLLSCGIGSWVSERSSGELQRLLIPIGLLFTLVVFGFTTPAITSAFRSSITPIRIAAAAAMLAPMGFFLGMCFPLGMKLAAARAPESTAWFWGMNGVTSVLASIVAVTISLFSGITAAFWAGFGCYVMAVLVYWVLSQKRPA